MLNTKNISNYRFSIERLTDKKNTQTFTVGYLHYKHLNSGHALLKGPR